jgi:glucans biosynthesis protein
MILALRSRLFEAVLLAGMAGACSVEDTPRPNTDAVDSGSTRTEVAGSSESLVTMPAWAARAGGPTLFEHVTEYARLRAREPYQLPASVVSSNVSGLTYAQYRGIRYRTERTVWRDDGPFQIQLFHPGGGNDTPVQVHLVEGGRATPLPFDAELFSYGDELEGIDMAIPSEAGYAGVKVLFPLNQADRMDEVVSFLGASYFRLLGPGHVYGLSSRGLAVDVAGARGEEFPDFVEFWLVRPDARSRSLTIVALLDGPSVSGAFHFELMPAADGASPTVMDVEARLFARSDVGKLGVAPLTSMYLHGTFDRGGDDDFRPRVHDSEGLLMETGRSEWIWRPLTNGAGVRLTSLRDISPSGFGLVQRDRDFGNYMDLEAQYHRRPSEWVEVLGDWGRGGVELLEIPTTSEFNDNIVASWVPEASFHEGEERTYQYRLVTFDDRLDSEMETSVGDGQTLAQVVRTRIGWDALPGEAAPPPRSQRRVVLDFAGGPLAELAAEAAVVAEAQTSSGRISDLLVHLLPGGGRRATFTLTPEGDRGADMRVYLLLNDQPVSETWSYLWEPLRVP